jgi:hypothetical protein
MALAPVIQNKDKEMECRTQVILAAMDMLPDNSTIERVNIIRHGFTNGLFRI